MQDNKMAGVLQPENFYKIDQFLGSPKDRKLLQLASYLKHINECKYILPIAQSRRKFEEIEIKIKEENSYKAKSIEESYRKCINDKKRHYRQKKTNSEVESLFTNTTEPTEGDLEKEKDQSTQNSEAN
jgi:hypothetical protein